MGFQNDIGVKTILIVLSVILFAGISAAQSQVDVDWEDGDYYNQSADDFEFQINSYNLEDEDRVLENTFVSITGPEGEEVNETFGRDSTVSPAEEQEGVLVGADSINEAFMQSNLQDLQEESTWNLFVEDSWGDGDTSTASAEIETDAWGSTDITINSVEQEGSEGNVEVNWTSTNNYNVNQELSGTRLELEDENGNIERMFDEHSDKIYRNGDSQTYQYSFTVEDYSSLDSGVWEIILTDYWVHETQSASTTVQGESPSIEVSVSSPQETVTVDEDSSQLDLQAELINNGISEEFIFDIWIEDGVGGEISEQESSSVSSGESFELSKPIDLSHLDMEEELFLQMDVVGQSSEVSERIERYFSVETSDLGYELEVDSPVEGSETMEDELEVSWSSMNGYSTARELVGSEIKILGDFGPLAEQEYSIGQNVGSEESSTNQQVIDVSDVSDGEYTVQVIDNWESESETREVQIFLSSPAETDTGEETTDDEETDDSGDSEQEINETEEQQSTEEIDDSEENTGQTDENGGIEDEEETEESEGSTEDSETGNSQSSEEQTGDSEEQVNQEEKNSQPILQGLNYGPSTSGIPLWIPALMLIALGILFRKSNYKIDI